MPCINFKPDSQIFVVDSSKKSISSTNGVVSFISIYLLFNILDPWPIKIIFNSFFNSEGLFLSIVLKLKFKVSSILAKIIFLIKSKDNFLSLIIFINSFSKISVFSSFSEKMMPLFKLNLIFYIH